MSPTGSDDRKVRPLSTARTWVIDSAVIDARCKADVHLVERLTQMVADRQAPFIEAHRSELTAVRVALDDSLRRARAYVADHG